jgi:hypothetical protein
MMNFSASNFMVLTGSLAALLLGIGCGGGGSLTKAEFIEQGDVVCKRADEKKRADTKAFLREAQANPEKPLSAKQEKEFVLTVALPPIRAEVKELKALGVPDEREADEIIAEFEKAIDTLERLEKANGTKNAKNEEAGDPFSDAAALAHKYGFKSCLLYY